MAVALKVFTKDKPLFSRLKNMDRGALLALPVKAVPFASRALGCMEAANIVTIGELTRKSRFDLLKFRGFGRKAADQVEFYLSELGLELASGRSERPETPPQPSSTARERELEVALRQAQAALRRVTEVLG